MLRVNRCLRGDTNSVTISQLLKTAIFLDIALGIFQVLSFIEIIYQLPADIKIERFRLGTQQGIRKKGHG
jgi:hypothetical protein